MGTSDGGERFTSSSLQARSLPQSDRQQDIQEKLAIDGATAKALAEAAGAAFDRLKSLDLGQLRAAHSRTAARAHPVFPNPNARMPPSHESHAMTQPNQSKPGQTSSNGNGHPNGGSSHGQSGGTAFTEPTPGGKDKTVAQLFGEIVWLFSQSPKHKNFFLSDLEWLVMTPILLKQFRVFYAPDRPIGVALWAYVTDEVEERLMTGNARLAPGDWKDGEKLWLVDVVAPYGGHDAMIRDLKENVFRKRELSFLALSNGEKTAKIL